MHKTSAEITAIPPSLFPKVPQFSNFAEAWKSAPFPRYIFNFVMVMKFVIINISPGIISVANINESIIFFPGKFKRANA